VPDLTELIVALPASTRIATFDNRPAPPAMSGPMIRGQQFHRRVQTAFCTGLVTADAYPEHTMSLHTGRRRVDLRHIRQLQDYLDHFVDNLLQRRQSGGSESDEGWPLAWDSVIGVLLYPRRPQDPDRAQLIEDLALEQALTIVWYDETDWREP